MDTSLNSLLEEEMVLRTQMSHLTPILSYFKERKLIHRQFIHVNTQCYEDQLDHLLPLQQQLTSNASIHSALSSDEEAENT